LTSYDQSFRVAAPGEVGVHAGRIRRFLNELERRSLTLHSLLLYRSGRVATEQYWWPYRADRPHMTHSATKSFTGTAVGFALAEGRLRLDEKVVSFFPDQVPATASRWLRAMTVGDLLTMRTGHPVGLSGKTWRLIDTSWVAEFLGAEVADPPGQRFTYSSATSHMLSAIVARATGESVAEYLRPRLFEPLGFQAHSWEADPEGNSSGGNGLSLRSVDLPQVGRAAPAGRMVGRPAGAARGLGAAGHHRVGERRVVGLVERSGVRTRRRTGCRPGTAAAGLWLPDLARAGGQLLRLRHVRAGVRRAAPADAAVAITASIPGAGTSS